MKTEIKTILKQILDYRSKKSQKKLIHTFMKTNNLDSKYVEGEDQFIKKWSQLTNHVDVDYYRFFSKFCGKDPNIVPADVLVNVIEPILTPAFYQNYYSDKNIYDKLLPKGTLPRTILRKIDGFFYDDNYSRLQVNDDNFTSLIDSNRVIVKPTIGSTSGINVVLYEKQNDGSFVGNTGKILTLSNLKNIYGKNFIIQECLTQSNFMSQFNLSSVNTLRMTVYRSVITNEPIVLSTVIRVGKKGSVVDNAHGGGKVIGVFPDGTLNNYAIDQYGDSKSSFNGIDYQKNTFVIPEYDKFVAFGKSVAENILHHRLIALDIMIDSNNNPKLIEFNVHSYGYWAIQLSIGTVFGDYTDEVIAYCKSNRSKIDCNITKYLLP